MIVTGRDLARIAHTIGVAPWSFTTAIAAPADADDAFALDTSPRRWRLALSRIQFERSASPQCVFLLRLPGGNARCGLGEGRPAACRAFPNEGGAETCSCSWDGVPLDDEPAGVEAELLAHERDRYAQVVARWNAYVAAAAGTTFEQRDFCRFLLDAYGVDST